MNESLIYGGKHSFATLGSLNEGLTGRRKYFIDKHLDWFTKKDNFVPQFE